MIWPLNHRRTKHHFIRHGRWSPFLGGPLVGFNVFTPEQSNVILSANSPGC